VFAPFGGVGRDHRERARARRDSFESSCVVFWSFQRVKLNGIFFKGTQKSSAQISGPQHMNSCCCFWKTNLPIVSAIERAENSFIEDRLNKKCFITAKSDGQLLTRLYLSVPEFLNIFSLNMRGGFSSQSSGALLFILCYVWILDLFFVLSSFFCIVNAGQTSLNPSMNRDQQRRERGGPLVRRWRQIRPSYEWIRQRPWKKRLWPIPQQQQQQFPSKSSTNILSFSRLVVVTVSVDHLDLDLDCSL
jgi:hypothetical protein